MATPDRAIRVELRSKGRSSVLAHCYARVSAGHRRRRVASESVRDDVES